MQAIVTVLVASHTFLLKTLYALVAGSSLLAYRVYGAGRCNVGC